MVDPSLCELVLARTLPGDCFECSENGRPALIHGLGDVCSGGMALEVAMLEFDQRCRVSHGREADFDFAGFAEVGGERPVSLESLGEDDFVRRVPSEDAAPLAGGPVVIDFKPSAADARLDDYLNEGRLSDVMGCRPPGSHVGREELEGVEWRKLHLN